MRHYCTYFDRNYLARGLTLYRSLERHAAGPFTLWILCCDEESFALLDRLGLARVRLLRLRDLEAADPDLAATRPTRSLVEYYWTATPALPLWLLQREGLDALCYLDADLFFFSAPEALFEELGQGSILAVPHRFAPEDAHLERFGKFNVGALAFRADAAGLGCLRRWRAQCLEWCAAREEAARFGDQKYLDEWPAHWGARLVIARGKGLGLGPWSLRTARLAPGPGGTPTVDGEPVVCFHFHGLRTLTPALAAPKADFPVGPAARTLLYTPYLAAHRRAWAELGRLAPGFRGGLEGILSRAFLSAVKGRRLIVSVGAPDGGR